MKGQGDVWKVMIPNSFFDGFNPYSDLIHGDWFDPEGRMHHTGAVYLNGNRLTEDANLDGVFYLEIKFDKAWIKERKRKLITTELLGKAAIPNLSYENPDGSSIRIDTDYFGKPRKETNPTPGPFENPGNGLLSLKVW
ncbi:MAG: hypothetical protein ACYC49_06595 [Ignavibacteriaceae bacterium]